ncbi:MAG TPA: hypothetical protein VFT43_11585, partial [Candidatus Polarisedimenticolia bacterium]|nr:hypothetical protein [Candidatus Polarisedimenticolia bacterium]
YQPEERYSWALAIGAKGEVYVATGERGVIYKISSKGKGEKFFDSEDFHVVSLALDAAGNLLAGTDGKGLLYRISPQGKATVLYDSPLREINIVAVDPKGTIYAAGIGVEGEPVVPPLQPPQGPPAKEQAPAGAPVQPPLGLPGIDAGATATVRVTASASGPASPTAASLPRSEVYRIDPDGTVSVLWSSQSEVVYALLLDSAGKPLIGSGEPGRIRSLVGSQQSTLLAKIPESQVTGLAHGPGQQIFAISSNVGRVYLLDAATSDSGSYLAPPRDAQTSARWGRIAWRAGLPAGGRVEITTRSGNSAVPDATWSDWSAAYANAEGSPILSPPARFVQWRARLMRPSGGSSPTLQAVSVAYVPSNLPPVVRRVVVEPPGVVRERPPYFPEIDPQDLAFTGIRVASGGPDPSGQTTSMPEKKTYVRGMRAIDWDADDPNADALSFDLAFRGEGESAWKPMARGLRDSYFAFDSAQLPDGLYRVRVEASDAPANPAAQAKSASLVSDPFLVDNTPPAVQVTARKGTKGSAFTLEVAASDNPGPIARAEYSLDAARWVPLAPTDGVSDSRAESYTVTLEGLRPGEHTVIVKVTDLLGNTGAGKATFTSD